VTAPAHIPVLCEAVTRLIDPGDGERFVDGTFGAGGYSGAFLSRANCLVWGIDRDPSVAAFGEDLARRFPGRFVLIRGPFGDMECLLAAQGVTALNGVALDLGVSSMQLDRAERGFSFRADGPLDMRMSAEGRTAADLVNTLPETDLADIIHAFGEERHARRIARAIVRARPLASTAELAAVIRRAAPHKGDGIDPSTRTFQALRIFVNDELGELSRGLAAAERLLVPGGRLVVVTFHSLEDRPVKQFLQRRSGTAPAGSRHAPEPERPRAPSFRLITNRPLGPDPAEVALNPRARSAKLRAAERTDAPPWPADPSFGEAA
jgi:16S rRNA (cytosine1402-N4)-methyltransferase